MRLCELVGFTVPLTSLSASSFAVFSATIVLNRSTECGAANPLPADRPLPVALPAAPRGPGLKRGRKVYPMPLKLGCPPGAPLPAMMWLYAMVAFIAVKLPPTCSIPPPIPLPPAPPALPPPL